MGVANGLVLRVFLPALIFDVVSSGEFAIVTYRWLIVGGIIVILGSGLIAWPTGRILKYPNRAFVPSMMFNNCGNLGLPVAVLAFGDQALEAAIILFLVSNLGHFTFGVYLFGGAVSWKSLVGNSVNIATILALVFNFTGVKLPEVIQLPINMLGQITIPLMLFSPGRANAKDADGTLENWNRIRIGLSVVGAFICVHRSLDTAFDGIPGRAADIIFRIAACSTEFSVFRTVQSAAGSGCIHRIDFKCDVRRRTVDSALVAVVDFLRWDRPLCLSDKRSGVTL